MNIRKRTWAILQPAEAGDRASRTFDVAMLTLIVLNVMAVIVGSIQSIYGRYEQAFDAFELFSVAVFSVEYLARVWSCTTDPRYSAPVLGRLRFALSPMALVDLLAVLPFYLPFLGVDLRTLRVLRVLRIVRVAKLGRYDAALRLIGNVLRNRTEELALTFVTMTLVTLIAATVLYHLENAAQPEVFSSIPATMWWAVMTLTTVGYGDVYPVTDLGRVFAAIIAIVGIGMFAIPTGILGAGFVEEMQKRRRKQVCPHCGKELS